jgi:hypothetical protein
MKRVKTKTKMISKDCWDEKIKEVKREKKTEKIKERFSKWSNRLNGTIFHNSHENII